MEDVERWDAYYGQGGLNYRHIPKRLLQLLHHRFMIINVPQNDLGGNQGVQKSEEPQIPHREGLLDHCGPEEGSIA